MPRQGKHLEHFYTYPGKKYKKYKSLLAAWCKYCVEAKAKWLKEQDTEAVQRNDKDARIYSMKEYRKAAHTEELSLPSRTLTLKKHLSKCSFVTKNFQLEYSNERNFKKEVAELQLNKFEPAPVPLPVKLEGGTQSEFEILLCEMLIATNIPFHAASHPAFHKFLSKFLEYFQMPHIPSPSTLSGPILNKLHAQVESQIHAKIKGKLGTGQCDGWKNKSNTSVVASMVSVEGQAHILHVHDVTAEIKSAKSLLEIVLKEILYLSELDVTVVAWVSDAGGDSRAMRKRLAELMPRLIVLDCWAHQINLIVKDYFKLKGRHAQTAQHVIDIVKWFNFHTLALGLLREQQKETLGKTLALILPFITRWTTHFLSASRLIRVKSAMRTCVEKNRDSLMKAGGKVKAQKEAAKEILDIIQDDGFWSLLQELRDHLYPLNIAAKMMQTSRGPLYAVTLTLANLYRTYDRDEKLDREVKNCLLNSIQKRWAKCDQDPFILALILNPYIRTSLFKRRTPFSSHADVYTLIDRMWTRLFSHPHNTSLHMAVEDYCNSKGPFASVRMRLDEYKNNLGKGETVDLVSLWTYVVDNEPKEEIKQLGSLAIHIHSVVANSTDCERLFSTMGDIHTKQRNRLDPQRVRSMAVVKIGLQRNQAPVQPKIECVEEESQQSNITSSTQFESCSSTIPEENPVKQEVVDDSEMLVRGAEETDDLEQEEEEIDELEQEEEETDKLEQEEEVLAMLAEGDPVGSLADATALADSDNEDDLSTYYPEANVLGQLQIKRARQPKTQEVISLPDLFDFGNNSKSWDGFWKSG